MLFIVFSLSRTNDIVKTIKSSISKHIKNWVVKRKFIARAACSWFPMISVKTLSDREHQTEFQAFKNQLNLLVVMNFERKLNKWAIFYVIWLQTMLKWSKTKNLKLFLICFSNFTRHWIEFKDFQKRFAWKINDNFTYLCLNKTFIIHALLDLGLLNLSFASLIIHCQVLNDHSTTSIFIQFTIIVRKINKMPCTNVS